MGVVGYFIGLILDNAEQKSLHFSSIPVTQEIFQLADIPEALIMYTPKENLTTVSIDFQVKTKPQEFRLSVLKNLQDYQFRVLEDFSKTIFSLNLDYPECNYPKLASSPQEVAEFRFDIHERSLDFQNAVQKIVPGIVLSKINYPNLYIEDFSSHQITQTSSPSMIPIESSSLNSISSSKNGNTSDPSHHTSTIKFDRESVFKELISYPPNPEMGNGSFENLRVSHPDFSKGEDKIGELEIMEDLFASSASDESNDLIIPSSSRKDVQQESNSSQRRFNEFLNDEDSAAPLPSLVLANDSASINQNKASLQSYINDKNQTIKEPIKELSVTSQREGTDSVKIDFPRETDNALGREEFDKCIVKRINKSTETAKMKKKTINEL